MNEEVRQFTADDDDELTLVAPRFDEEETLVARRVVPLGAAEVGGRGAPRAAAPVPERRPRRGLMLALAFASALGGGVLGGAGLYLYQSRASSNPPPAPDATGGANAPAQVTQPAQAAPQPAPTAEDVNVSTRPAEQQHDAAPDDGAAQAAPPADGPNAEGKAGANQAEEGPASDGRDTSGVDAAVGARKRGKKGEHDEETQPPRSGADPGRQLSRDGGDAAPGDGAPRRADTIFERPRRAAQRDRARGERPRTADSIRAIFEGQPR